MINRSIMTGMLSVGVDVHDYGVTPLRWCVSFRVPMGRSGAASISGRSPFNASFLDMKFFDDSGLDLSMGQEKNIENLFFREDFVRPTSRDGGDHLPGGKGSISTSTGS